MSDIIKLGKTMKGHIEYIPETIRSEINSAVVDGLNNKLRTAFKMSYGLKPWKYRGAIICLVAEDSSYTHNVKEFRFCNDM